GKRDRVERVADQPGERPGREGSVASSVQQPPPGLRGRLVRGGRVRLRGLHRADRLPSVIGVSILRRHGAQYRYAPYTLQAMMSTPASSRSSSRPSTRGRRGLTRDAIVQRALEIGDEEGLEAVRVRRAASDLGVTPVAP